MNNRKLIISASVLGSATILLTIYKTVLWRPPLPLRPPTQNTLKAAFPKDTKDIFDNGTQMTLLSLDGSWNYQGKNDFHKFRIIGQTEIRDSKTKQEIKQFYYYGLADTEFSAACFNPHHGIRIVDKSRVLDLVICFACKNVDVWRNGEKLTEVHIGPQPKELYNRILTDAGIELDKQ